MKHSMYLFIVLLCSAVFLTSCWDQELLKESKLVYGAGFDYDSNNSIRTTFVVRNLGVPVSQGGVYSNRIVSVTGKSPRDTRLQMDRLISKQVSASKNQLLLLGDKVAKQNIDHMFDILFRDPKSPLDARVAVVDGLAEDYFNLDHIGDTLITEFISNLIKGAENKTEATKMTVEKTFRYSKDEGQDYALPYITLNEEINAPELTGLALFHKTAFTGVTLSPIESTLLLLMKNERSKKTNLIETLDSEDKGFLMNTATINVRKSTSDKSYSFQNQTLEKVVINLELRGNIEEYPQDHLVKESQVKKISEELSGNLTLKANEVLKKLQKANCDFLGIGRDMSAYHPEAWNAESWDEQFKNLKLESHIKIKISETGIIK
ncbi:MAG: Ger(x)C family spore germination protein [Anaerobacillus sp.]